MMKILLILIPFLPLLGFLVAGIGFRKIPARYVSVIGPGTIILSFIFSLIIFFRISPDFSEVYVYFDWINVGTLQIPFSFLLDPLSALMMLVVTGVGSIIHIYSVGYMHDDPGYNRFFAYMNLFVFSMLLLVLGGNYLVMFIGWEGVGLCSYLLIGFWFKNHEYNDAAKKAFIMNRIGDLGFLLGMFLIFYTFGTLNYSDVFSEASTFASGSSVITAITLLLFVGAVGKSAQIPLYTWLPDAMAGPTPVSALIHAATMVTAGVYLVARSNLLFAMSPITMEIIAITGLATAIFAAVIAVFQYDIKKILAYSTISQLGYMFVGLGTGAFTGAMFHLTTHAFFKAMLFLAAGSVIHALSGEQDIRKMGGLKRKIPYTWITFLVGTIAISGIPPLSGFFSKDQLLVSAFSSSWIIWAIAAGGSFLTVFYMFRLFFMTFSGKYRGYEDVIHESPKVMIVPLLVLAFLSIFGGFLNIPELFGGGIWMERWLEPVFRNGYEIFAANSPNHTTEWIITSVTLAGVFLMMRIAWKKFGQSDPSIDKHNNIITLIQNKFYIDEVYDLLFVKPLMKISLFFHKFIELKLIDKIFESTATATLWIGFRLRYLQTGNVGFYLFVMVFSIIGILIFNILI